MGGICTVGGYPYGQLGGIADKILAHDTDYHAGGADVLLYAAVDHAVIGHVAGLGEEHGGLVGYQNLALGVGQLLPGHAVDGLVFADIDVIGVIGDIQIAAIGYIGVVPVLAGGHYMHIAVLLGFVDGFFAPCTGLDIAGYAVLHQVHGDHSKLERSAALYEQHLVVVGNVHQVTEILLGFVDYFLENL